MPDTTPAVPGQVDDLLLELDAQMPDLQLRHGSVFALANAWAERHDAIVAVTPSHLRDVVEARLGRIGKAWGVTSGGRITAAFRALEAVPANAGAGIEPVEAPVAPDRASVQSLASWILGARRYRA